MAFKQLPLRIVQKGKRHRKFTMTGFPIPGMSLGRLIIPYCGRTFEQGHTTAIEHNLRTIARDTGGSARTAVAAPNSVIASVESAITLDRRAHLNLSVAVTRWGIASKV